MNGRLVLVKHTPESWRRCPSLLGFSWRAVEHGEDFEEVAVRELKEETGINVKILDLVSRNPL